MVNRVITLILLIGSIQSALAQTGVELRGSVRDSLGTGLANATVTLLTSKENTGPSKDTLSSLTDKNGYFNFSIPKKCFELLVTMKGYIPLQKSYSLEADSTTERDGRVWQLSPIVLQPSFQELVPVTILRIRPILIRGDTVVYQAAAFNVREGAGLGDLLKRLPGLEVDAQGNVLIQGKKIQRLMVNGQDFFGGDILMAIRNLPADLIEQVQVIDDYGDKARLTGVRSGEPQKVLNIELQKSKETHQFGQIEVGGGTQGKHLEHVSGNTFKNDRQFSADADFRNDNPAGPDPDFKLGLNYGNRWSKKENINGNLLLSSNDPILQSSSTQDNIFANGQLHQEQSNRTTTQNHILTSELTFTHRPDSLSQLRLKPFVNFQDTRQTALTNFSTRERDSGFVKTTVGNSQNSLRRHTLLEGINGYYEKTARHSRQRLVLYADVTYSVNQSAIDNLSNTRVGADSNLNILQQHYLVNSHAATLSNNALLSYYMPLKNASFLEFNYTWQSSRTPNSKIVQQTDSLHPSPNRIDSLSTDYLFRSVTQFLHAGYIAHLNKLDMLLFLEAQPSSLRTTTKGKDLIQSHHYFVVLPTAQFTYLLNTNKKLSFAYASGVSLPGPAQLSTTEDISNPQYPVTGNPDLKPEVKQLLNLHYEQADLKPTQYRSFSVELAYSSTRNMIVPNLVHPRDSSSVIQRTTYINSNGAHSVQGIFHISFPSFLNKQVRISMDEVLSSSQTISVVDSIVSYANTMSTGQTVHCTWIIPDKLEADLIGNYTYMSTQYHSGGQGSNQNSSAAWGINNRHTILRQWLLSYTLSQSYTSNPGTRLQSNPANIYFSLQRQFLAHNRASLDLSVFNVLNNNSGVTQTITPTSFTSSRATLTGRYFLLTFQLKLEK